MNRRWHYKLLANIILGFSFYLIILYEKMPRHGIIDEAVSSIEKGNFYIFPPIEISSFFSIYLLIGLSFYLNTFGKSRKFAKTDPISTSEIVKDAEKDSPGIKKNLNDSLFDSFFKSITPSKELKAIINIVFHISIVFGWPLIIFMMLGTGAIFIIHAVNKSTNYKRPSFIKIVLITTQTLFIYPFWRAYLALLFLGLINFVFQPYF